MTGLQVIGAGVGRTGTNSLKLALETLLGRPVGPRKRGPKPKSEAKAKEAEYLDDLDIEAALAGPEYHELSEEDRGLAATVAESYRRALAGEALEPRHFILSGHELPEYRILKPAQRLRYVAYRYKYNKYPELKIVGAYPPCVQVGHGHDHVVRS